MTVTCYHAEKHLVWTHLSGDGHPLHGPKQLRYQCDACGRLLPGAVAQKNATCDTPQLDEASLRRWIENDRGYMAKRLDERFQQRRELSAEGRERHQEYLQSNAWADRRALVMDRAGGLCEGCRSAKATQVHHLSYAHQGNEFLWELVAVCRPCHERFHGVSS